MTGRPYHHGDLRTALLVAGEAELVDRGPEKFSLRGVAKRAGVSHAAPAHHFRDKAGLLTAIAQRGFEAFADRIWESEGLTRPEGSPVDARHIPLIASGMAYVDFALGHPKLFSLMFASSWPDFSDPELDASSTRAFEHFVSQMQNAFSEAGLTQDEMHVRAMANWSAVHGLAVLLLEGRMTSVIALPQPAREETIRRILGVSAC